MLKKWLAKQKIKSKDEYDYAVITAKLEILIKDLIENKIYSSDNERWESSIRRLKEISVTSPNLITSNKIKDIEKLYKEYQTALENKKKISK